MNHHRKAEVMTIGVGLAVIGAAVMKDDLRVFIGRGHHLAITPAVRNWRSVLTLFLVGV